MFSEIISVQSLNFLIFPVVGAVIGALTNDIAIRMLFRPYNPIYFWRFKLPLTPGVIPSQRYVIAHNIAKVFEDKLLSGGEIHSIITGEKVQHILAHKIDRFMDEKLGRFAGWFSSIKPEITKRLIEGVEEMATSAIAPGGELDVASLIEKKINEMKIQQLEELVLGFSREQFRHITIFGGVLGFVIGLVQAFLVQIL